VPTTARWFEVGEGRTPRPARACSKIHIYRLFQGFVGLL
jgi:hypothetical protein